MGSPELVLAEGEEEIEEVGSPTQLLAEVMETGELCYLMILC